MSRKTGVASEPEWEFSRAHGIDGAAVAPPRKRNAGTTSVRTGTNSSHCTRTRHCPQLPPLLRWLQHAEERRGYRTARPPLEVNSSRSHGSAG
jgi:hypothetical protein